MAFEKKSFSQENFRIKLLSGNNVILAEADEYESEIFAPQIVNGRIAFINVIPNRRCCTITKTNVRNSFNTVTKKTSSFKELNVKLAGQQQMMGAPLANSTPTVVRQRNGCGSMQLNSADSNLSTPQSVRKAVPIRANLMEKSMLVLQRGIKVSRSYHKMERHVTGASNTSGMCDSANISILNSSFRLHCSSISAHVQSEKSVINIAPSSPIDTISKWEKVLTPVRTYTRKYNEPIMLRRPVSQKSARNMLKFSKYKPTYLVNPTKGPNVTQHIEIRKCKLKRDTKTCISPKTFKKQQKEAMDGHTIESARELHRKSLSVHKSRPYLGTMGMSAFDLLTNSNRVGIMTRKLNEQFRKGCVNKASSTYNKYKVLSTVTPLQQDEQVLEFSNTDLKPHKAL